MLMKPKPAKRSLNSLSIRMLLHHYVLNRGLTASRAYVLSLETIQSIEMMLRLLVVRLAAAHLRRDVVDRISGSILRAREIRWRRAEIR